MAIPSDIHRPPLSLVGSRADYVCAGILAAALYMIAVHGFGPGITNDSVNYLSAATTVEEGMKKADGTPFFEWPPLFPLMLSLYKLSGIKLLTFATVFLGLTYTTNVLLALYILKRVVTHRLLLGAGLLWVLLSAPLLQVHVLVWSEPFFLLLVLLMVIFTEKYLKAPSVFSLACLILLGILACLQRKSGIYFIPATALIVFISTPRKWLASFAFAICTSLPAYWFLHRRQTMSGKYFGAAGWSPEEILHVTRQFLNTFTSYLLPSAIPLYARVFLLVAATSVLAYLMFRHQGFFKSLFTIRLVALSIYFSAAYYLLLILSLWYIHISEEIDDRILSPVYLPFLIFLISCIDRLYTIAGKWIVTLMLILCLAYSGLRTGFHLNRWNTSGTGGYNTGRWQKNQVISYLAANELKCSAIITNNVHALSYYINFRSGKNFSILSSENAPYASGALLVCLAPEWNFPGESCREEKYKNKTLKAAFENEGSIWELTGK